MARTVPEINSCDLPDKCGPVESEVYRKFRDIAIKAHCAAKRGHQCCGAITIDREHITMNCPLCGDARQIL